MASRIDSAHLREQWLPRLNALLGSVSFATNRYQVHRVYICAVVVSQDEAEISHLLETTPFFSVTQEKLDWQPDDELNDLNEGDVFQHLFGMSASEDQFLSRTKDIALFGNVQSAGFALDGDSSELCSSLSCKSFRLSSLEIFNAPADEMQGYHIGATAFEKLEELGPCTGSSDQWGSWMIEYIVKLDESPKLVWAQEGLKTAVLWQVQVDTLDLSSLRRTNRGQRRRKRYGPLLQVRVGESSPESRDDGGAAEAKRFKGVRWRADRKAWVAEMRLPNKLRKNKVSFGDFKSQDQAARAVDAVYHYYDKREQVQFADTPQFLPELPARLNDEQKLEYVKSKAKWLAHHAPILPCSSSPTSVNAQEIPIGHTTAVSDMLCSSPTPPLSLVSNILSCTSGVGGSMEMSLEQSFNNNLTTAEQFELDMQTMLLDQFSCGMGSDIYDLLDSGSSAPSWFYMDSLPGFDVGDADTQLLDPQYLQDQLF